MTNKIRKNLVAVRLSDEEYAHLQKCAGMTDDRMGISTYIRDAKIARARVFLETTALPVAEISERLAFNTPNYFIQSFRSVMGCTPAQYRKKYTGR